MEGSAWYSGTNHRWTGPVLQAYWKETYWRIRDEDVWTGDLWMNIMKQDLCEDLCYCILISTRKHSPWRGMEYWVGKMMPPVFVFSYPTTDTMGTWTGWPFWQNRKLRSWPNGRPLSRMSDISVSPNQQPQNPSLRLTKTLSLKETSCALNASHLFRSPSF